MAHPPQHRRGPDAGPDARAGPLRGGRRGVPGPLHRGLGAGACLPARGGRRGGQEPRLGRLHL